MARIRSVHPKQTTDEAFVECGPWARLLAIFIRNFSDDQGVFEWKPKTLKMEIFPADDVNVSDLLAELERTSQVRRYEVEGRAYGVIRNFLKYQKPKFPNATYPLPDDLKLWRDGIGSVSIALPKASGKVPPVVVVVGVKEEEETTDIVAGATDAPVSHVILEEKPFPSVEDLQLAIKHWNFQAERLGLAQVKDFTDKRRRSLKARLTKLSSLDAWIALVDSLEHRPFCRGENPRGWRVDFDFLMREDAFTKLREGGWLKPGMSLEPEIAHAAE